MILKKTKIYIFVITYRMLFKDYVKNYNNTYIKILYENNELHRQSVNSLRSPRFRNQSVKGNYSL